MPKEVSQVLYSGEDKIEQVQIEAVIKLSQFVAKSHHSLLSDCVKHWKKWIKFKKIFRHWVEH